MQTISDSLTQLSIYFSQNSFNLNVSKPVKYTFHKRGQKQKMQFKLNLQDGTVKDEYRVSKISRGIFDSQPIRVNSSMNAGLLIEAHR